MKLLLTGGCGFVGWHRAEDLVTTGHHVVVLDNLSTGRYENVAHLEGNPRFELVVGNVLDTDLVAETTRPCDGIFHLASAVGVKLIMVEPVQTIETLFPGTD